MIEMQHAMQLDTLMEPGLMTGSLGRIGIPDSKRVDSMVEVKLVDK